MGEPMDIRKKKSPSISDVAALAGVSISSVSRYLNNGEHLTSGKKQSIARAIQMLDYHPSILARGLANSRSNTIAFFAGRDLLYGVVDCIRGVEDAAIKAGAMVNVVLFDEQQNFDSISQTIKSTLSTNPLGIIINQPRYGAACDEILRDAPEDTPVVLVGGNRRPGQCQLFTHDDEGGYAITKYLLSLGHQVVHHVAVPENDEAQTRQSGWRKALEEEGIPVPPPYMASWDPKDAEKIGWELGQEDGVTAVFVGNDEIAMGVMRGLHSVGKRVPEDISIAGFDDNPIAGLSIPSLTTWRQDFELFGAGAVKLILNRVSGSAEVENDAPYNIGDNSAQLVVRESTAPPPSSHGSMK